MSIFSKILSKLGFGDKNASAASAPAAVAPKPAAAAPAASPPRAPAPAQATMSEVDVVSKLEQLAKAHPEKLNWKVSIVDLMKLLDMDSSLASRKDLAIELGYPRDKTDDSAAMNTWLHKTVLRKLAENGGNIPTELLG